MKLIDIMQLLVQKSTISKTLVIHISTRIRHVPEINTYFERFLSQYEHIRDGQQRKSICSDKCRILSSQNL